MTATLCGHAKKWSGSRSDDGHREWKISYQVKCDPRDGPATALATPGLPLPGALWIVDNDLDIWAWCRWNVSVEPRVSDGSPNTFFDLEYTFSTKPELKHCREFQFEDPLLEPQRISGSFNRYQEEATTDRFGIPILSSSFEQIRGPQVEFDANRVVINIEQNVPLLRLAVLAEMQDTVNDRPLWGLPARTIKLNVRGWERKFYGSCYVYYTRQLEFEVRKETFDRYVLDEGSKVLSGKFSLSTGLWEDVNIAGAAPNRLNPQHFIRYTDRYGNQIKGLLNGAGRPAQAVVAGLSGYYISVSDNNVGNELTATTVWLPVIGDPNPITLPVWNGGVTYPTGKLVIWPTTTDYYVALQSTINSEPPDAPWLAVPNLQDEGVYDAATTYNIGALVRAPTATATGNGVLGIQKYNTSNFLFLGIPVVI